MSKITSLCSLEFFFLCLITAFLLFLPGFAEDSPSFSSSNDVNVASRSKSKSSTGLIVFLLLLGLSSVVAFSVFLYKIWKQKKREAQQAHLLKLFEQDDELEVELSIRD